MSLFYFPWTFAAQLPWENHLFFEFASDHCILHFFLPQLSSCLARGDRMKQAQTDADELIAAYRLEQQDAFDKAASASGKFCQYITTRLTLPRSRLIPTPRCVLSRYLKEDPAAMLPTNSKRKQTKIFRECRVNSPKMLKRRWMFSFRNAARSVWRYPRRGSVLHKSCSECNDRNNLGH